MQISEQTSECFAYERVVDAICGMNWTGLSRDGLVSIAAAYYYFSVQFRENLEIACQLHPNDRKLQELARGECNTDNLSPWPGVALPGERMNHDEFMRRLLDLEPIEDQHRANLETSGLRYLDVTRAMDDDTRARSIASYEDGGLEKVFGAILTARHWDGPLLAAFRHFLEEHIRFDQDPDSGHGALSRHLVPDDRIVPLWREFERICIEAAPALLT